MLSKFRNIIIISSGYSISICSTMIMYILLPVLYTEVWWSANAGLMIMIMTLLQVFVFWPIAAHFVDKYSAKTMLFVYAGFFILWALFWLGSYLVDNRLLITICTILMTVFFAAGYGSRFIDVYTLRMSPQWKSGIAFWRFVTFAWLWRFLWTLLQPHLMSEHTQLRAPIGMIIAMIIFIIMLFFIQDDAKRRPQIIPSRKKLHHHLRDALLNLVISYKKTFVHGWVFIKRCKDFPLITLSISFWEGILFGSLWFIIPLYLANNPDYVSYGFEIGVYEIISVLSAIGFWYIADKYSPVNTSFIWRWGVLIWIIILYLYPVIETLIPVWIILWLSNSLLYATGQRILSEHDEDHEDDGAYGQTRNMITNIWYMCMPVIRWLLEFMNFKFILQLFWSILSCVTLMGIIITFYVLIMKRHTAE